MNLKYIYHSGFLLELDSAYMLFDYYMGQLPDMDKDKKLYVFVSHSHGDHFNEDIFQLFEDHKDVEYILSSDVVPKRQEDADRSYSLEANMEYYFDELGVQTYMSTDLGLAYMISYKGMTIYHAGDLNWWTWVGFETEEEFEELTRNFKKEIDKMAGMEIDLAMVPLDPRQAERFDWGMKYFIEKTKPRHLVPMHCWNKFEVIDKFRNKHSQLLTAINLVDTDKIPMEGIALD
ncbi:MBL fold metallo-hydrolase [Peptostreptococcus sp. MV1]|uniref:MBL fold metallo-hydrolase n=1 Tax=Peptostreptococcus sp. MV1 TaxID=1219626 RepID=UPI000569841E|nr:MBL fold metallo-hydrolase [Peptostreptococcus sp. MV1]